MGNIGKCPNCILSESEAYRRGYADAWNIFEKEIIKAQQLRPIQIIAPKGSIFIETAEAVEAVR